MEFMSNIGSTADVYRPSLFELVAQDKLNDLFRPALRYMITVYAQRYPRYLLKILNYYDELYALLMAFIERHYLLDWNGSFSESFYGLRRVKKEASANYTESDHTGNGSKDMDKHPSTSQGDSLTSSDIRNSLIMLVVLPYVKNKLDTLYDSLTGGEAARLLGEDLFDDEEEEEEEQLSESEASDMEWKAWLISKTNRLSKTVKRKSKTVFTKSYPFVHLVYHVVPLGFHLAYLFDRTDFYAPSFRLTGLAVRRLSPDDYRAQQSRQEMEKNAVAKAAMNMRRGGRLAYIGWMVLRYGLNALKVALPMAVFVLKFLEWWYGSGNAQKSSGMYMGPLPDPPEPIKPDPAGVPLPEDKNLCSLCGQTRTNPAMLPTGYIFCYPCLFPYVQDHGRCPVTLTEVSIEEVRKLFAEDLSGA